MTTRVAGVDIGFTRKSPLALVVIELGDSPVLELRQLFYPPKGAKGWEAAIDGIGEALGRFVSIQGLDGYYLSSLAYELPHITTNAQTAIKLAHMCGIVRCIATTCGVPVQGVQPTQAKVALTGNGAANKEDMVRMAYAIFGEELSEHEADACGVALAGASLAKLFA